MGTYHIPAAGINFTQPLIVLYRIGSDLDELAVLAINKMIQVRGPNNDVKMWRERERQRHRDRQTDRQRRTDRQRQRENHLVRGFSRPVNFTWSLQDKRKRSTDRDRENSNSKTLFYKDCSLGSAADK